ncbi:MAG: DNA internalization-related competence protein ComEC/Rec2 [Acidobacteriota bacterium]|nr:DNA internalization-related competence protein ComEC/Rec2 [Acidobacteriota bacterium]
MPLPGFLPATCLLAGCLWGLAAPATAEIPFLALAFASLAAAWTAWTRQILPIFTTVTVAIAFTAVGAALALASQERALHPSLRQLASRLAPVDTLALSAVVEGQLTEDAGPSASGVSLALQVDRVIDGRARYGVSGGVRATVAGELALQRYQAWTAGRRVRVPMELRRPSRYLDPGVPDGEVALARRGTALVGVVKSGALVEVRRRGAWPLELAAAGRRAARRTIAAAVGRWSAQSAAIVSAIVLGDRAGLDETMKRRLQEAGTYHVIAISGGNIAILAGLVLALFAWTGLAMRAASVAAIVVLVGYAALVGGGASVNRATLMAVIYLCARALDHRGSPFNALAVAGGLLVAADPLSIVDAGFVLTFGATAGILIGGGWFGRHVPRRGWLRAPAALLLASLSAETALLPVGALVFERVTVAGLVLNFAAIPLMGLAQLAGMALLPAALLSSRLAAGLGFLAHLGASGLLWTAGLVEMAPWLAVRVPRPSAWVVAVYYAGLAAALAVSWWRLGGARRRAAIAGCVVVSLAAGAWMVAAPADLLLPPGRGRLRVVFLDVGQGDAMLIRSPHGRSLLVDTGGLRGETSFDMGDRVVGPALRALGVRRLDYFVLTHGDADHMAGASSVVRDFGPREIWEGVPVPPFEPLQRLRAQADRRAIPWRTVHPGDRLAVDGVELLIWHPPPPDWERQKVRNDDSIVMEVRYGGVSVLLTGDIGREVEQTFIDRLPPAPLRILKVPHHGSGTSSSMAFLRAVRPAVAVVSAGRGNPFGHPAPQVLARYRAIGAEILRTDRDGAVTLETDGSVVTLRTWTGRSMTLEGPRNHEGGDQR